MVITKLFKHKHVHVRQKLPSKLDALLYLCSHIIAVFVRIGMERIVEMNFRTSWIA